MMTPMFKVRSVIAISITLLLTTTPVFAGVLYLSEIGTPISVGTAGVGGVTNTYGPDSVYTNPAGRSHWEAGLTTARISWAATRRKNQNWL